MAITINALTTGTGGLETTADASGSFSFQSDGTTIATVTSSGFSVTGTFDAGSLQVGGSDVVVDTDIGSTVQAYDAGLTSIAGLTTAANKMIYATASDTYAVTDLTAAGRAILDDADAAAQRTTLGLGTAATTASTDYATAAQGSLADSALQSSDIGSTVQAYDADLTTLAGLSSADGNFIVGSATGWVVESGATARTSLGLGTAATTASTDYATAAQGSTADSALQPGDIGSTVQAYDADLTTLGGLAKTDGNFIVGNGSTWVAESGATVRTSLGLGGLATLSSVNAATITDNSVGAAELNVSGNGTSGQALTSDGDGSFSWTTITTSVTPADVSDQSNTSTGYFDLPAGTTAQRPVSPSVGMIRSNTSTGVVETYNGTSWIAVGDQSTAYSADYLVVGGGGAGGTNGTPSGTGRGGGGGAGGFLTGSTNLGVGSTYTVVVGSGGSGTAYASDGSSSSISAPSFTTITALGGGAGGASAAGRNGRSGGSGGGGGTNAGSGTGGAGTSGQGNNGGNGLEAAPNYGAGGGGGAGAVGSNGTASNGGNGGNGTTSSITGTSVTYAGGGGGGTYATSSGTQGSGGSGGGGAGGWRAGGGTGTAGTVNTGSGGGGGTDSSFAGSGGSGVVILRVLTTDYTGTTTGSPTVTTSGSYTVIKFTSSGSYTA